MTTSQEKIESIKRFEQTYKDYLNLDGTINKLGLSLLRSIRFKGFSWNDRKINEYEEYHLGNRVKSKWNNHYEYFNLRSLKN